MTFKTALTTPDTPQTGDESNSCKNRPGVSGIKYFWSTREINILKQHYETPGGPATCLELLPKRTLRSIQNHALRLGLTPPKTVRKGQPHVKWKVDPMLDQSIKALYLEKPAIGKVRAFSTRIGRPMWWIRRRANYMGLTPLSLKEPRWTEEEDDLVQTYAGLHPEVIRKKMAKQGHKRTVTAIVLRIRRSGIHLSDARQQLGHYNANQLGQYLGVADHTVVRWIRTRLLMARPAANGSDRETFTIKEQDIRTFVADNPERIDLRKVDRDWFIRVLAGRPPRRN